MVQGPFPPQHQGLGGTPSVHPDLWINLVFLPLFTVCGVMHFSLFLYNKNKRGILFPFNAATMGFCSTRTIATSLRIAWCYQPRNIHLAMTAQIFVYAGVIVLIISNLWWTVRIVRAQHPTVGWSKPVTALIPVPIILSACMIVCLVISVCLMFYLPDPFTQRVARRIQQTGGVMFALWAVLPLPILLISTGAMPFRRRRSSPDNFGRAEAGLHIPNTITLKVAVCTMTGMLLGSGACFRAITNLAGPIAIRAPTPWYFEKWCFYTFNFSVEFTVVAFWLLVRVDKIFNTPNGARGPGSYGGQWRRYPGAGDANAARVQCAAAGAYASQTNLCQTENEEQVWSSTATNRSSTRDSVTTVDPPPPPPPPPRFSGRDSCGEKFRSFTAPPEPCGPRAAAFPARGPPCAARATPALDTPATPVPGDMHPGYDVRESDLWKSISLGALTPPPKFPPARLHLPSPSLRVPTGEPVRGHGHGHHRPAPCGLALDGASWIRRDGRHVSAPVLRPPPPRAADERDRPGSRGSFFTADEDM